MVATLDGRKIQREKIIGNSKDAIQLGIDLANSIQDNGGNEILEEVKRELNNWFYLINILFWHIMEVQIVSKF